MNKKAKRFKKAQQNPKTVDFQTLDNLLQHHGFSNRKPGSGGSHYVYTKGEKIITVPFKRPYVKETYVKRVLEIIEEK